MSTKLAVIELQNCDKELQKQKRLKKLRKILRVFLVGFLIGKDADKKISELTAKRDSAIRPIRERLAEIETAHTQIKEISDSGTVLSDVEQKQWISRVQSLEKDVSFFMENGVLDESALKHRELLSDCFEKLLLQGKEFICGEISKTVCSGTYLTFPEKQRLMGSLKTYEGSLAYYEHLSLIGRDFISAAKRDLEVYRKFIDEYNVNFVERRKKEYTRLFRKEGLCLDEEQKKAIVTDDQYNLVVAAAGSGKTEVLITRIAYLIERKPDAVKPDRILAIAFQKKAKDEIEKRILEGFGYTDVNVSTFHKLGKDIVEKSRGKRFPHSGIVKENEKPLIIKEIYEQKIKTDKNFYNLFLDYMRFYNALFIEFGDKEAVLSQKEISAYVSINNTHVNSRAEKEIMDFFLTHKINGKQIEIEYEPEVAEFRPDFRLTEFDLYIEHWGINEKGQTPSWFNQSAEEYKETMERKKEWLRKNNKLLVETFSYEYDDREREKFIAIVRERVLQKLKERYDSKFEFSPMTYEEIVEVAWAPYQDPTSNDIGNFIKNAKVYGLTPNRISEKLRSGKWSSKQIAFALLSLEVYRSYEQWLQLNNKIDFEDMINKAIEALLQNGCLCYDAYDHILIDEYQDISAQRNKLIKILLERNPKCKLFCVGDDWQSIMGFAGSNVNFFVSFGEYFSNPAITKISTNYRSQKTIVEAGAALIKNNGSYQVPKVTVSNKNISKKIRVICSDNKKQYESRYFEQTAEDCADRIAKYIKDGLQPNEILVLSRYKFPRIIQLFMKKARERGIPIAYNNEHPKKSQIRLMTAHGSKGLQAKVVFILNVIKDRYGFPCEREDSSILEPARENYPRQDQKQEERRLFYVAITRAMDDLIIYTWEPMRSQFLNEIPEDFTEEEWLHYWKQET
ncbi:MAG TPA: UvrD-helicase domain-containing protein [Candidatus Bathyarchaeia archaeon]|nr:UvrD-helicase domain-containing protein [Candidatus Bathyarchaeia archaeon]